MLRGAIKTILLGGTHYSYNLVPIKICSSHFMRTCQKVVVQINTEQKRHYQNFGHKRESTDRHSYLIIFLGLAVVYTASHLAE